MEIVKIGDIHFDGKVSSMAFLRHQELFFRNQFIPYLLEHNIKDVFQLGDIFDRRTNINTRILYHAKRIFFDPLRFHGINLHILVGNHDMFHLDTLMINSPEVLLSDYENVKIYTSPQSVQMGITSFDIIPWVCKENEPEIMKFIKESHSDYCLGHFEISGFPMYRGHVAEGGISPSIFKKYKEVWSGHYHTRSSKGNIRYVGTPTEITWQDCDDPRGFEVFNTKTLETKFIQNNYTLFQKIIYNDQLDQKAFDFSSVRDKYIKIIVENKINLTKYNDFVQRIYESGCHDVSIVENFEEYFQGEVKESVRIENTMDVVNAYIDSIDVNTDKEKLKSLMQRLHVEALNAQI